MRIDGKVALVTGGASGLGAAAVDRLRSAGATVYALSRGAERGEEFVASRPGIHFIATDVGDEDSVADAVSSVLARSGAIDILVNCAGMGRLTPVLGDHDDAVSNFADLLRVNLLGTFIMTRAAANAMLANEPDPATGERGAIVWTSSIGAYEAQELTGGYGASKAGINALTIPVMRELAAHGIRVNTVAPGLFFTEMSLALPWVDDLVLTNEFPKRGGEPDEFAALVAHMIENVYLNGEVVRLDAGARPGPRASSDDR